MINRAWWERHYLLEGGSGHGSTGKYREWKWGVIELYIPQTSGMDVIDIGCGDLQFWHGRSCAKYLGIDWSETIITKNRKLRVGWDFLSLPAEKYIPDIRAKIVLCFDLLIHIESVAVFRKILENLCWYSEDLIFVYNWIEAGNADWRFCFYHPLEVHMDVFRRAGFRLLARHEDDPSRFGAIYVFRKEIDK